MEEKEVEVVNLEIKEKNIPNLSEKKDGALLEIDEKGNHTITCCNGKCHTGLLGSKSEAKICLEYLWDEKFISDEGYENVFIQIENSTMPRGNGL